MNVVGDSASFAGMMNDVSRALLGTPNLRMSREADGVLRFGNNGSVEVNIVEGWFADYEADVRGGVLDLIAHKAGISDSASAFRWLEENGIKESSNDSGKASPNFYDYRDATGAVLFRVERRERGGGKTFVQHGPDGQGGFVSRKGCMQGVRRMLYRLPELIASDPAVLVFVCEGEKDADRLAKGGLVATTNPGGAGKFHADFAPALAGRRVVILEDNDQPGRDHAEDVLRKVQGHAAAAAVLRLPGLPEKGDVSDWFDAGGTVKRLHELAVETLAAPQKSTARPAFQRGISAAALMAKHFEPVNYVVPGLLVEGATLFGGKPKIGKSWMAYDFALAIASGRPVFGSIPITQGDVLYLALEDSERRLKSRLLKKGVRNPPERLTLVTEWPDLDHGCIAELEAWADAVERPALVIVDVLKMVRGSARNNESKYDEDYRALTGLAKFARDRGIAVLVVHHVRKMEADDPLESLSGTNGLTGAADTVMVLKRDIGTGNCLLYVRGRDIEENETAVRFDRDIGTWQLLGPADEVGRTNERQAILDVLRQSDKPLTAREISDILGKNYDAIRKTLARMAHADEIGKAARGSYTCPNSPNVPNHTPNAPAGTHGTHGTGDVSSGDEDPFDPRGWNGE